MPRLGFFAYFKKGYRIPVNNSIKKKMVYKKMLKDFNAIGISM